MTSGLVGEALRVSAGVKPLQLNETMIVNPHCHASVIIMLHLTSYHGAIDGSEPAIHRCIRQPHREADGGRKLHASRQAQVKTGSADIVEDAFKTKRLIFAVYAPNPGNQFVM